MLLLFLWGAGYCPELEDFSGFWLTVLGASAGAFALFAFGGAAWVFDVEHREEARERAAAAATLAAVALAGVFLAYWNAEESGSPVAVLGMAGAVLCVVDGPWAWLDSLASAMRHVPAVRDYALGEGGAPAPKAWVRKAPAPLSGEALLMASGAFRMDRERLLSKLSQFQLANAEDFLLPWLRLAEASGASRIDLDRSGAVLELRFDGRPLAPKWTAEPYAAMVEEDDPDAGRHRHLAYGLLAVLRLGPRSVETWSGSGESRARLSVTRKGLRPRAGPEPGGPETLIRVRFDRTFGGLAALRAILRARDEFGLGGAKLFIGGRPVPPEWRLFADTAAEFSSGTTRGVVIAPLRGQKEKVICFHYLGVFARRVHDASEGPPCIVWVRDDTLSLSLSQDSVVENEAYQGALRAALEEGCKLAPRDGHSRDPGTFAYSKTGLLSALGGAALAWVCLMLAIERRPDLAVPAFGAYAGVSAGMLGLCWKWARARLAGRANPLQGS